MSVRVSSWVWQHSRATLGARLVLLAIADCAEDDGTRAFPSLDTLAKKSCMSRRAVVDAIDRLVTLGELVVDQRRDEKQRQRTNAYSVVMEAKPSAESAPGAECSFSQSRVQFLHEPSAVSDTSRVQFPTAHKEDPSVDPSVDPSETHTRVPARTSRAAWGETRAVVERVMDRWREVTGHPKAILTAERVKVMRARLAEGYGEGDLLDGVDGIPLDPWPDRPRHCDLTVVFRTGASLEKFRDMARSGQPAGGFADRARRLSGTTLDLIQRMRGTPQIPEAVV